MADHPLQFYFNLIEESGIQGFKRNFYNQDYFIITYLQKFTGAEINWNNDKQCYIIEDEVLDREPWELNFRTYLSQTLNQNIKDFKTYLRSYLLDKTESDIVSSCKKFKDEVNELISTVEESNDDDKDLVLKSLEDLNAFLLKYTGESTEAHNIQHLKLKWLGKINTLVTLFYDLSQESNNLKTKLIEYDRQKLTDFIVQSFVDAKDNAIEPSTVYRILDANPLDLKKAKQRLEIKD